MEFLLDIIIFLGKLCKRTFNNLIHDLIKAEMERVHMNLTEYLIEETFKDKSEIEKAIKRILSESEEKDGG